MAITISSAFDAGNIRVVRQDGDAADLEIVEGASKPVEEPKLLDVKVIEEGLTVATFFRRINQERLGTLDPAATRWLARPPMS